MKAVMTRRCELVLATIVTSLLVFVPIARAGGGKLDVYVNPLEFNQRIPRLAVGEGLGRCHRRARCLAAGLPAGGHAPPEARPQTGRVVAPRERTAQGAFDGGE